ncbi:MAG: hypothetical protein JJE30_11025 [Desulfuromonadales bacterium]|nr:hypothetical protein [Desulfuromonadales bacterium]
MSGAKSGGVSIIPMVIFGAVGAAATLVVGGVAFGVVSTVNAYRSARDRIEREREQATAEQKRELNKVLEEWQSRLASSSSQTQEAVSSVKSTADILAGMVTNQPLSTNLKDGDLLASLREAEQEPVPPVTVEMPSVKPTVDLQELIENIQGLLLKVEMKLPESIKSKVEALYREQRFEQATEIARGIRIEISHELARIAQEKQEEMLDAKTILEGLPPDFPSEARAVLTEAAEGRVRFDLEAKKSVQEMIQMIYRQAAAQVMHKTFTDLGYEIEPVGNSLFTDDSDIYFRKNEWEDGYCVKLKLKGDRINFFMQKTSETGDEYDKDMEQEWKDQFPEVQKKLREAGLDLNVNEDSPPGKYKVPTGEKIKIDTRKKRTPSKGREAVKHTESTEKRAAMEKQI